MRDTKELIDTLNGITGEEIPCNREVDACWNAATRLAGLEEENEHLKHIMKSHDQVCAEALAMEQQNRELAALVTSFKSIMREIAEDCDEDCGEDTLPSDLWELSRRTPAQCLQLLSEQERAKAFADGASWADYGEPDVYDAAQQYAKGVKDGEQCSE